MSPVSLFAAVLLLVAAPLMRGGNRPAALIVLELIGTVLILSLCLRSILRADGLAPDGERLSAAKWLLILSPAILALVYLMPIPSGFWAGTPGRGYYVAAMRDAGVALPASLPLSVVPAATLTSLLAGIPLVGAFLIGHACSTQQLTVMARAIILMAFAQVVLGLLQISGGEQSPLYFGVMAAGRPIGTFANSNHFANYLAIALMLYVWLAWGTLMADRDGQPVGRHLIALWMAGGLLLVVGILMSRSRGAALSGLPMAALALGWLMTLGRRRQLGWRSISAALIAFLMGAVALLGFDFVLSRFAAIEVASSASFRSLLTQTTLAGAAEFWPWGAGWGVYGAAYPRFQPPEIPGAAGHAHQDYAQMLFEGGIFSVVLMAAFLWLAVHRAIELFRIVSHKRHLRRETIAAALSGLGLLGFLLHSLVEFNMHIPANAILACLLAGVYLRPLADKTGTAP